jgi:hypothetical protein
MKNIDWNQVEDLKDYNRIPAGGYICVITAVEDVPEKEYLKIEYDISNGDYRGYFKGLYLNKGFWGGSFVKSYKVKAQPFFKAFKTAVEASNPGYTYNNDEKTLVGKYVGLVLGEEEYLDKNNKIRTRTYVDQAHSAKAIQAGEFEIPELKKLKASEPTPAFAPIPDGSGDPLPWE